MRERNHKYAIDEPLLTHSVIHIPSVRLRSPKKPFTFDELQRGLVNFVEFAFTLGVSAGTCKR